MRDGPSPTATIIGTLFRGEQLEVLGTRGAWFHVRVRNSARTGWVSDAVVQPFTAPASPGRSAGPVPPPARPRRPSGLPNALLSVNAAYQATSSTVTDTTDLVVNAETGSIKTTQHVGTAPAFDISAIVPVQGRSGIAVGFSRFQSTENADIVASVPHPFFFNQPRTLDAKTPMMRQENALHVDVMVLLSPKRKIDLAVFGGLTVFWINNDFVSKLDYSDDYPYDSVTFGSATIVQQSKTAPGLNVGADLSYAFSRSAAVGGFVRFSGANVDLSNAAGSTVNVKVGGLQVGGGLRLRF